MPWQLLHKCNLGDPSPREFGVLKTEREGRKVTLMLCENPDCREQVVVEGHELFKEAVHTDQVGDNLPPGFWIPRSRRRD